MKKLIYLSVLFVFISCRTEKQNAEHLIFKKGVAFKPDSDKPYTGAIFALKSNGKIDFEGYLTDGKRNGEFIKYGENEIIKEKENYKDGEKNGEFTSYDGNGQLRSKEIYKNNKKDGLAVRYNDKGNKYSEEDYIEGLKTGKHKYWFNNGIQIQAEVDYSKGTAVIESVKEYFIDGKIKTKFQRQSANLYIMTEYYSNGNIKHEVQFKYLSYEGLVDCSNFKMYHQTSSENESIVNFDLGNSSFLNYVGEEKFKNEFGNVTQKILYFYPFTASVSIKNYNGETNIYDNVTSYTMYFDERGNVIKKCARGGGDLGCYPDQSSGNKFDDMQLVAVPGGD